MINRSNDSISLIAFGEILWDVIGDQFYLGGSALNLAAHASQLGMQARLISRIGEDALGRKAVLDAAAKGVDVTDIGIDPAHPTGTVIVNLIHGQPEYEISEPAAWDFIEMPESIRHDGETPASIVCFGTLAQRGRQSQRTLHTLLGRLSTIPSFYDVNLRKEYYSQALIEWGFRQAKIVKLNDSEAVVIGKLLFGREMALKDFAREIQNAYDIEVVLLTLGSNGCLVGTVSGTTHVPSEPVRVEDTVGAGDAFSAGFLSAWLSGKSPVEAAAVGNAIGGYVATQSGAVPTYSAEFRSQLNDLLGQT